MSTDEAIYRLDECECYNAGFRCGGCQLAVESLSKFFNEAIPIKARVVKTKRNKPQPSTAC